MSFDLVVHRLKGCGPEEYMEFLMVSNPGLIHFLNFFTDNFEESREYYTELIETLYAKVKAHDKPPENCKLLLFRGAHGLIRKKNKNLEILNKCNEQIYEEVLLQPLPERIFDTNHIPTPEELDRFRSQQLSTPMRLILDLIFQEKFTVNEVSKILNLSENVLEPFVFTVTQRLMGDPHIESPDEQDELTFFSHLINSQQSTQESDSFVIRFRQLQTFLSLDIRDRLSHSEITAICQRQFEQFADENNEKKLDKKVETSLIDQIRQRNKAMKLHEAAQEAQQTHTEFPLNSVTRNPSPKINENIFIYAKYALWILAIFISTAFYRTLVPKKIEVSSVTNNSKINTLTEFQKFSSKPIGTIFADVESPVKKGQWINTNDEQVTLELGPDTYVKIAAQTRLQIESKTKLFLQMGSLEINIKKHHIIIHTKDGEALISTPNSMESRSHISKPHYDYTVMANLTGSMEVTPYSATSKKITLKLNEQIILGINGVYEISGYDETLHIPEHRMAATYRRKIQQFLPQTKSTLLTQEELSELIISREKIKEKPSVTQKDFLQKL